MKKSIGKFFVSLAVILMVISSTASFAEASNTDWKEEKTIVKTVEVTNEEMIEILEEQSFDKELIESYKSIIEEEKSSFSVMAATPNFIRWYSDGSFEIGLNKETLRWVAVVGTAGVVGVLAAIPGVGWAVGSAISGVILGYASSTIPKGYAFAFVPFKTGTVVGYKLHGVYDIAGY